MRELRYCLNEACHKRHCLCHPSQRHWKDPAKRGREERPEPVFHDGGTPCGGYIPLFERKKYNINIKGNE